jgi:peptide/nickel transport system substrate-binding protein
MEPGQSLTLKRNPDYWAKDLPTSKGLYNFDEIRIDYFRDATSLYEAFKAGIIDYRDETNPSRWRTGYDFPAIRDGRMKVEQAPLGLPKGLQGFAFNTRRTLFRDVRVREALGYMFDFEWINANLFGGLYSRTTSFFDDSELASTGRPASPRERELLARWPGAVRADILEGEWAPPRHDGTGRDRDTARRALALLNQAGFGVRDGALRNMATGAPFSFEIMVGDRAQERLAVNFAGSLARIGVEARVRLVDEVQYQRRRQKFEFDMMIGSWIASASPGNEQRSRWGSASADQEASFNLAGARSPAIDGLIADMLAARSHEDFVATVRAYDRVLLSGFYVVPMFHAAAQWFAYSAKLAHPAQSPRFAPNLFGFTLDSWWRSAP